MERQKALSGLILLASMSLLTNACNDDEDTFDATGGAPTAGKGSSGSAGSAGSGKAGQPSAGEAGMDGSGGKAGSSSGGSTSGSSGSSNSGGTSGEGGMPFGGEGGEPAGGSSGDGGGGVGGSNGGSGGGGGSGGTSGGSGGAGAGGTSGGGGSGGSGGSGGGPPEYCYDHLYIPLGAVGDQADFEVQYPGTIDLSDTVITVRVRADMLGNGGGFQVYLKNGAPQSYASVYLGWNSLSSLSDWVTLTYDIASVTPSNANFSKTAVEWVGFNITTGDDFSGAVWDDVDVYVDSLTFSDDASTDIDFNSGVPVLSVNQFNSPVAGAAVSAGICEEDPGTGGAGGVGGGAGSGGAGAGGAGAGGAAGSAGTSSGGGGAGGTDSSGGFAGEMGAAGEGGMPGAGGDPGTGGTAGTDPTGGTGGSSAGTAGTAGTGGTGGGGSFNLVGNGGFELGNAGWVTFGNSAVAQTTTFVRSGTYAGVGTGRTDSWQGPSAQLWGGPATYQVGLYALQNSGGAITLALSAKLTCGGIDSFLGINSASAASGAWTSLQGTLTVPSGCTAAQIYVQQNDGVTFPDIYVDDLVVTATSITNFAGNPGFESGTASWYTFGGSLAASAAYIHSGSFSGLNGGRSASYMGPAFSLPTGAGSYSVSVYALQDSGSDLPFLLSAKLTCNASDSYPTVASATGTSAAWVQLAGTVTVPSGCTAVELFVQQNGGSTFPNIYVDDLVALPAN